MQDDYAPLRTLRDVEELERVPLDQRIFSWNLNDWIAQGCTRDPGKIAVHYIADGDPDGEAVAIPYRELQSRAIQAANLFHSLGVSSGDVVLYVLPTLPQLYVVMLGALARGIACGVNWMLAPEQLIELIRSTRAKVVVTLGPTPGYEIWENMQAIRARISPSVQILTVPGPGGTVIAGLGPRYARRTPARRPSPVRARGRARRHRGLCPFRRNDGIAQAGEAHPSRVCVQVLGQCRGHGAYA